MYMNYLLIAWRHMLKNKLYATLNVLGLVLGLTVYLFGSMLATYEREYDLFFEHADRIYTVGSVLPPDAPVAVTEFEAVHTAVAPLIEANVPEVEAVSRTVGREYLVSIGDDDFYQEIRFVDPAFTTIFDFNYLEGDPGALSEPTGVLISRTVAEKFFGTGSALGRILILDHSVSLHVAAVIEDLPANTHFNTTLANAGFEVVAPLAALNRVGGYDLAGNFNQLGSGDLTYILVPADKSLTWLQGKLDGVYERHYPTEARELVVAFRAHPLREVNTMVWDMIGLPAIETVQLLGILVLIIAIVNYTNLATAQCLGRTREIGLRKAMGATKAQMLQQFLVESLMVAAIAMLIALALLELCVPAFNEAVGRDLSVNYSETLPWLGATALGVGLAAGAYPAYLISQTRPIDALRDGHARGVGGALFRSAMLGLQFTISIFMLAMVLVVYFQNTRLEGSGDEFPKSEMIVLQRLEHESLRSRYDTMRHEISNIPGVQCMTFSSQVPYDQATRGLPAGTTPDEQSTAMFMQVWIDEYFMDCFDIPILAGRNLSSALGDGVGAMPGKNAIINELAVERFGFASAADALGKTYYDFLATDGGTKTRAHTIVGVVPSLNFQSFFNQVQPMVYLMDRGFLRVASVRVNGRALSEVTEEIKSVWDVIVPEYPMQAESLDDLFGKFFMIFTIIALVLAAFAFLALSLSLIGLFGLAAFMVQGHTREIGIRKVMGANTTQIIRLLIWRLSKPVLWALLIGMPLAYVGSGIYLDFFTDRLAMPEGIIVGAGLAAVLCAWGVVAVHAVRIARSQPINALRWE